MIILLFGAPGTGKSTYAKYLAEKVGSTWVSTGGILRDLSQTNFEVKKILESGQLISDELVNKELFAKLDGVDCDFVLDGFPRNLSQMGVFDGYLNKKGCQVSRVYHLVTPIDVVVERLKTRGRMDDSPETIRDRYNVFEEQTRPVIKRFESRGVPVTEIDNTPSIEEVKKRFDDSLKNS